MNKDKVILYTSAIGLGWMSASMVVPKGRDDVTVALILFLTILWRQLRIK